MKRYIQKFGSDPKDSQDFSRVVHENHVHRIKALLEATQGAVVAGGMVDPEARYIAPTIVQGASLAEPLMRDEIFGPVLPVIAVGSIEEAIEKVNMVCSQPLALYVYAEDKVVQEKILMSTRSGGVGINTSLEQITNIHLLLVVLGQVGKEHTMEKLVLMNSHIKDLSCTKTPPLSSNQLCHLPPTKIPCMILA